MSLPGGAADPVVEDGGGSADLVRERLNGLAALRALDPLHEEVAWWHKRTRMVLESVIEGNRGLRGALKAFDSLSLGPKSRSMDAAGFHEELGKAENLLRNLLEDLSGTSARPAGRGGASDDGEPGPVSEPGSAVNRPVRGAQAPEARTEAFVALFHLAEALERDPGLSAEERHDFRLDIRTLHQEMMKYHPDARRVLGLIESLSRFEVDLSAVRRSF